MLITGLNMMCHSKLHAIAITLFCHVATTHVVFSLMTDLSYVEKLLIGQIMGDI